MSDGSSQQRSSLLEGRDAGQHLDADVLATPLAHLINQRSHAVDASIAARDDNHGLPFLGKAERLFRPLAFLLHARVDALAALLQVRLSELEIILIADDGISLAHRFQHSRRGVSLVPRADARHDNFSHKQILLCVC